MKKSNFILTALIVLFSAAAAFSQENEKWIRKPLTFTRNKPEVNVTGMVQKNKLVVCYVFKARKNQRITTAITSDKNNSRLVLSDQEGDPEPYTNNADDGSGMVFNYEGIFQSNNIYEICAKSDWGKSNYNLRVRLQ